MPEFLNRFVQNKRRGCVTTGPNFQRPARGIEEGRSFGTVDAANNEPTFAYGEGLPHQEP
jgi:hypothetical protein